MLILKSDRLSDNIVMLKMLNFKGVITILKQLYKTNMQTKSTTTTTQQTSQTPTQQIHQQPTLILRLQHKPVPRVSWTQDTIDNQHMNKKKSNLCCIYHRPGQSSSDTCTSDDEGNALQRDRHTKHLHKQKCSKRKTNNKEEQKLKKEDSCCKGAHHHQHEMKFADEQ